MYQTLDLFRTSHDMARHAGTRQALTAQNIANADTPGYVAKHIAPFSQTFESAPIGAIKQTRPGHLAPAGFGTDAQVTFANSEPSPNGNAVSIEDEILQSVDISREHNRALMVYRHTMTVLRASVGK